VSEATYRIARSVIDAVCAHALAAKPAECCGMLVGRGTTIAESAPAANVADRASVRYLIDPRDHIDAIKHARERHLDVLGFYHSHPHTSPWPSSADVTEAAYPDAVYLIVSLADTAPAVRLFRIADGAATELPLAVMD